MDIVLWSSLVPILVFLVCCTGSSKNYFSIMWLVVWKQTVVIVKGESLEEPTSVGHSTACVSVCTSSFPLSPLSLFLLSPPFSAWQRLHIWTVISKSVWFLLISAQARNPADYVDPGRGIRAFLAHEMVPPLDCCVSVVKDKQSCWIVVSGRAQGSKMVEISTQIHQFLMTIKSHLKKIEKMFFLTKIYMYVCI